MKTQVKNLTLEAISLTFKLHIILNEQLMTDVIEINPCENDKKLFFCKRGSSFLWKDASPMVILTPT